MESRIYDIVRSLHFKSTYEEIVEALKLTLEYFENETDIYKKRCIVKYWGDKFGNFVMVEVFNRLEDKGYNVFASSKSAMMYAAYYFSGLKNIRDFKVMAKEIIRIYETELADSENYLLTEEEAVEALETAYNKVNFFKNMNLKSQLFIFLHEKRNLEFNSYVIPSFKKPLNKYFISCFQMPSTNINPVYVFYHELGHVLLCELTGELSKIPYSFYKLAKKNS